MRKELKSPRTANTLSQLQADSKLGNSLNVNQRLNTNNENLGNNTSMGHEKENIKNINQTHYENKNLVIDRSRKTAWGIKPDIIDNTSSKELKSESLYDKNLEDNENRTLFIGRASSVSNDTNDKENDEKLSAQKIDIRWNDTIKYSDGNLLNRDKQSQEALKARELRQHISKEREKKLALGKSITPVLFFCISFWDR